MAIENPNCLTKEELVKEAWAHINSIRDHGGVVPEIMVEVVIRLEGIKER